MTNFCHEDGRIPTRHRRAARWADFHTAPAPGKVGRFPYRHVCSLCYLWIVQLSGSLVVWRSVPRNRPRAAANAQYGAATRRRAAVPARRRAAPTAHHRGGRAAAAWRRAGLWLCREGLGRAIRSALRFPAICGRCPFKSGVVAFHALTGIRK